jgi:hypothetical protein
VDKAVKHLEVTMKKLSQARIGVLPLVFLVPLSSIAYATTYQASNITGISAYSDGTIYIRWPGLPNPGSCGANNNWVMIPASANDTLKSLARSLYFSGKPVRIDTSGCNGNYEVVTGLYSPTG